MGRKERGVFILSLLSGVLVFLSFPKWDFSFLAWIALIPLMIAIEGRSQKEAFLLGFLFGITYFLGAMYWLFHTLQVYGHLSALTSSSFLLLLTAYLAMYPALFCWIVGHLRQTLGIKGCISAPFVWTSLEFVRNHFLTGLPWVLIGYSQYKILPIVQVADLTGIYGISFLVVMGNTGLLELMKLPFSTKKRRDSLYPIAVFLLIGLSLLYGIWRIDQIDRLSEQGKRIKIGIAQGNIPQEIKWNHEFQERTMEIYRDLTLTIAKERPDIVIWPETSAPFFFQSDERYSKQLLETVRMANVDLLFGSPAYKKGGKDIELFNRAYLISGGLLSGYYDKVHLVPFGEYVPMRRILPFVQRMVQSIGDFSPGRTVDPIPWKKGVSLGVLICFESIFPELSREFVSKGARLLVNITNDAWFGRTSAPYQHLSMLTIRAVENRVPIARSANTGISAMIDAKGRIYSNTDLFKREVKIDNVSIIDLKSTYTRWGDIFSYICIGSCIIFFFFRLIKEGKEENTEGKS